MDQNLQLEDTVSADRKERIIYVGPGKTRKISSITSRQNFNNEKFTRKANKGDEEDDEKEQVEESAMQTTGTSTIDNGAPTQSDTISQDKPKKSNNPQIEFVTGTEKAGSASTAIGNAQNMGIKKISEAIVKKALANVKADKNVGTEDLPFDPDTSAEKEFKKPHNPNRSPMDTVRALAQKGMKKNQVKEEAELEEAIRIKDPIRAKVGDVNYGKKDGSFQGEMERKQLAAAAKDRRKVTAGSGVSGFNSKMTAKPSTTETGRVRAVKEDLELDEKIDLPNTEMGSVIKDFQKSDAPQFQGKSKEKRRQMAIAAKLEADRTNEETTMSKTYAQFVEQLLEYTPGPGGVTRVQGRSYGAQYHDPEGDDDADDKPAAKVEQPKRGRGRPKGATSGANHKVTSGKKNSGVDYTGFKLHLPNSNR